MADNLDALTSKLKKLEETSKELSEKMGLLSTAMGSFANALPRAQNAVNGLVGSLGQFYDVTLKTQRSMELSGNSVQKYQESLMDLHKSTNLSLESSARLFATLERGFVGLKDSSSMGEFIKNVHNLGLTTENTERIISSASIAQSKYVDIIDRINKGGTLDMSERMSLDPNVARDLDQLSLSMQGVLGASPEQDTFLTSMQNIRQTVEDLQMTAQKALTPLLQGFEKVATFVSGVLTPIFKSIGSILGTPMGSYISTLAAIVITMATVRSGAQALRNVFAAKKADIDRETEAYNRNAVAATNAARAGATQAAAGRGPRAGGGGFMGGVRNSARGLGSTLGMGAGAVALGVVGSVVSSGHRGPSLDEDGNIDRGTTDGYFNKGTMGGALSGAATGASIGMMFGPVGAVVGAAVGGLAGFVSSLKEQSDELKKVELAKTVFELDKQVKNVTAQFDDKIKTAITGTYNAETNTFEGEKDFKEVISLVEEQAKKTVLPLQQKYNALAAADPESDEAKAALKELQQAQAYATNKEAQYTKASAMVAEDMRAKEQMAQVNVERLRAGSDGAGRIGDIARSNMDATAAAESYQAQAQYLEQQGREQDKLVKNAERQIQQAKQQQEAAKSISDETERSLALAEAVKNEEYARGKLLEANAKKMESMNQALEKRMEANSVRADIAMKEATVAKNLADAEEALSSETRMGMGATYEAKIKSYQATLTDVQAAKDKVKAEQENLSLLQREAAMATDPVLKEQALSKAKAQSLKVQEAKITAVQKETEAQRKLNQLRDSYINALEETSLGGLDVTIDPTQDQGLVYFMTGSGGGYGHHLVGGGGKQSGIPGNTMASGATGNSWFTNNSGNPQSKGAFPGVPVASPGQLAPPVAGSRASTLGIPIESFDSGGISTTPGLYFAGVPEAHVPLDKGAIPVRLSGGGMAAPQASGGTAHITVNGVCTGCRRSEIINTTNSANSSLGSKGLVFTVGASL